MADGKWISNLEPTTAITDAARRVLALRLEVVRDYLPHAIREADKDIEYVHQLRVGTRRAGAALRIFAECLPPKVHKKARKKLRGIRRAAGAARDWDVFLLSLGKFEEMKGPRNLPAFDFLYGFGLAQRMTAQTQLEAMNGNEPFDFEKVMAETVAAVRLPDGNGKPRTLLDMARPLLAHLLHELEQTANGDLNDYAHLHEVRIIGKRLRYAMEVFACCFGPDFRETIYPAIVDMQEILGRANDSHVASSRLLALREKLRANYPDEWKRLKPGFDALLRFHQRRLPQERQQFLDWWQTWKQSSDEAIWSQLLHKPEGTPAPDM
ncbi:MAG: CHAD domain-containing protein [Gemmataceae bacterium]